MGILNQTQLPFDEKPSANDRPTNLDETKKRRKRR